jgi:large-conductance mechanosensitive channel
MLKYLLSLSLLLVLLCLVTTGSAEESEDIDASVISTIDISIIDGNSFTVEFTADISFITLAANEKQYSREEIGQSSPEILGAIKYALKSDIVSQIRSSFPGCILTSRYELPLYDSGVFSDEYDVNLTSTFFTMNESVSTYDLINGLLDSGVLVNYSFPWTAKPGWDNTYTIILTEEIGYKRTNGNVQQQRISWDVFNKAGTKNEQKGTLALMDVSPTTDPSQNETVSFVFSLDCRTPETPFLSLRLQAHRLSMNKYDFLPSVLSLPSSLPADAVRLFVEQNFTTWDQLRQRSFLHYEVEAMNRLTLSSFNQSFNETFTWDEETTMDCFPPFTINAMDEIPPIVGMVNDPSVFVSIQNISARAFFGLINAGAKSTVTANDVNFADVFDDVSLPSSNELYLPDHVLFDQEAMISWNHSTAFSGSFESENPPSNLKKDINRVYQIDVKSTDLNLLSFFTGTTEVNLGLGFEKNRNIHTIPRSSDLLIPSAIDLSFINADAFRLCVEENVFSEKELDSFITRHENELENMSKRLFPSIKGSAVSDLSVFEHSLLWDGNISTMGSNQPVIINQVMESTAPLSCHISLFPPQFSFASQNLTFIGVAGETVTYNLTFPKGVSVDVESFSQNIVQKTSEDDTDLISVTLNASETGKIATIVLTMQPSLTYVLGLFMPCIISIIITLILFFVVYVIRKKRNMFRQKNQHPPSPNGKDDYQNEDYYVPPKPPSSR